MYEIYTRCAIRIKGNDSQKHHDKSNSVDRTSMTFKRNQVANAEVKDSEYSDQSEDN